MQPHPLINFEIQKYYKNGPRFNGVYSRNNLNKIRDKVYVINLYEYSDMELIGLFCAYKIMMLPILILPKLYIFQ